MNTNETNQQSEAPKPVDITSENLSFSDYQRIRRGETVLEKSAPVEKTVQKNASESETEKTEVEDVKDELENEAESDDDLDGSNESKEEKPKKKSGFQRRIDKLNARNAAALAEIEHWKQQALKSSAIEPSAKKVEVVTAKTTEGKPDPENFETHSEYVEALTDWKIEMKAKAAKEEAERAKIEADQKNAFESHAKRVQEFSKKVEDFQDVLEAVDDVPVSLTVQEVILSSENGPALMYELAKNRAEYERICKLPPLAAARELGKIESKIASNSSEEKKQEPKKLTNAPKPIEPVGKGSSGSVRKSIDDPDIPFAEYERLRREQMKRRG